MLKFIVLFVIFVNVAGWYISGGAPLVCTQMQGGVATVGTNFLS